VGTGVGVAIGLGVGVAVGLAVGVAVALAVGLAVAVGMTASVAAALLLAADCWGAVAVAMIRPLAVCVGTGGRAAPKATVRLLQTTQVAKIPLQPTPMPNAILDCGFHPPKLF
jgi:hypothetical protein